MNWLILTLFNVKALYSYNTKYMVLASIEWVCGGELTLTKWVILLTQYCCQLPFEITRPVTAGKLISTDEASAIPHWKSIAFPAHSAFVPAQIERLYELDETRAFFWSRCRHVIGECLNIFWLTQHCKICVRTFSSICL